LPESANLHSESGSPLIALIKTLFKLRPGLISPVGVAALATIAAAAVTILLIGIYNRHGLRENNPL